MADGDPTGNDRDLKMTRNHNAGFSGVAAASWPGQHGGERVHSLAGKTGGFLQVLADLLGPVHTMACDDQNNIYISWGASDRSLINTLRGDHMTKGPRGTEIHLHIWKLAPGEVVIDGMAITRRGSAWHRLLLPSIHHSIVRTLYPNTKWTEFFYRYANSPNNNIVI